MTIINTIVLYTQNPDSRALLGTVAFYPNIRATLAV